MNKLYYFYTDTRNDMICKMWEKYVNVLKEINIEPILEEEQSNEVARWCLCLDGKIHYFFQNQIVTPSMVRDEVVRLTKVL